MSHPPPIVVSISDKGGKPNIGGQENYHNETISDISLSGYFFTALIQYIFMNTDRQLYCVESSLSSALCSKGCHLKKKLSQNVQLWKLISLPIFI